MDQFFTSESAKYVFALTQLDGETRMNMLGVKKILYVEKELATTWKDNIETTIFPFKEVDYNLYNLAIEKLYKLYERMIKD